MTKTIFYTATSLDGFIADENHSLEWLFHQEQDRSGPLNYDDFFAEVGALAMGRSTYDWILDHEFKDKPVEDWKWTYSVPTWVFTHREPQVVPGADITFTSDDVPAVHEAMVKGADGRNVWIVGGGDLAGQFADHGLLDEVIVAFAPVMLGAGAPLLPRRLDLETVEVHRNGAFACGRYRVVKA